MTQFSRTTYSEIISDYINIQIYKGRHFKADSVVKNCSVHGCKAGRIGNLNEVMMMIHYELRMLITYIKIIILNTYKYIT